MINKLIEKYKKEMSDLEQFSKVKMECGHFLDATEIDVEVSLHKRFLRDLEELKEHQLETLNQTKKYLNSQKATPEMIAMAIRKIEISILGVDRDE